MSLVHPLDTEFLTNLWERGHFHTVPEDKGPGGFIQKFFQKMKDTFGHIDASILTFSRTCLVKLFSTLIFVTNLKSEYE